MQNELVAAQRLAKFELPDGRADDDVVHLGLVDRNLSAAGALGFMHRQIRVSHEAVRVDGLLRGGDQPTPTAGARTVHAGRRFVECAQVAPWREAVVVVCDVVQNDAELVSTQTGGDVAVPSGGPESGSDVTQTFPSLYRQWLFRVLLDPAGRPQSISARMSS